MRNGFDDEHFMRRMYGFRERITIFFFEGGGAGLKAGGIMGVYTYADIRLRNAALQPLPRSPVRKK